MQTDAPTAFLFKLWPWIEANKNRIIGGIGVAVVVGFVIGFFVWRQNENETEAGLAFTKVVASAPSSGAEADAYLKVAADYPNTTAGERALLQAAATLFAEGRFADAQTQFQHFLDFHPDNPFSAQAALGVASCLDAQGKTDAAISAYQNVARQPSDENTAAAKFSLARIYDSQGKREDARNLYGDIARTDPNTSIGMEAGVRAVDLRSPSSSPPTAPSAAPAPETQKKFSLTVTNFTPANPIPH